MIRIRLRYILVIPIFFLFLIGIDRLINMEWSLPQYSVEVRPKPKLPAGFYLVLHTSAKTLPQGLSVHHHNEWTYIGPLSNIKDCHQTRIKINPLYPNITHELIKIEASPAFP